MQTHAESCLKRRKSLTPATKTTITSGATSLAWPDSLLIVFMSSQSRSATCKHHKSAKHPRTSNAQKKNTGPKGTTICKKTPRSLKDSKPKGSGAVSFNLQGAAHRLRFFGKSTDLLGLKFLDLLHFLPQPGESHSHYRYELYDIFIQLNRALRHTNYLNKSLRTEFMATHSAARISCSGLWPWQAHSCQLLHISTSNAHSCLRAVQVRSAKETENVSISSTLNACLGRMSWRMQVEIL